MAIFGEGDIASGISVLQAIAAGIGAIVMGGITGALVAWRQFAKTRSVVAEDAAAVKEVGYRMSYMDRVFKENADNEVLIDKLRGTIDGLREEIGGLKSRLERSDAEKHGLADRIMAAEEALERAMDKVHQYAVRVGACDEKLQALREEVIDYRLANGMMFTALAEHNRTEAEAILTRYLRPKPGAPGPPPPPMIPPETSP
jgi:hypothetical protein